jgi:hypothetical protein
MSFAEPTDLDRKSGTIEGSAVSPLYEGTLRAVLFPAGKSKTKPSITVSVGKIP